MEVELLTESLSPGTEMSREENVDRLREFIKKLQNMKSFTPPSNTATNSSTGKSPSPLRKWKNESKGEWWWWWWLKFCFVLDG